MEAKRPEISIEDILTAARRGEKINLIKMFRQESGRGLKESKEAIEACEQAGLKRYNEYQLINKFYEVSGGSSRFRPHVYEPEFYDKEKFLADISKAIDAGKVMRCYDMLDAVITFCNKILENGGIDELARERENFIDRI